MTYELTDDHGNRYGQTDSLDHAKVMARHHARAVGTTIYVMHLATSSFADGRYGESVHYTAYPERNRPDDAEIAKGMVRAQHIRDTERFVGSAAAAAEELAWELKDPEY